MQLEGKFIRIAHDPGDPQITSHCPFCGSGQVTGRSDGTIDCAFCGMNYIVRVQPAFPGMPQQPVGPGALTDIGPEMGPGGMDPMMGMEEGPPGMGMPPGMEGEEPPPGMEEEGGEGPPFGDDEEGPPGGPEEDADEGGGPPPPKDKGAKDKDSGGSKKPPPKSKKKGSYDPEDLREDRHDRDDYDDDDWEPEHVPPAERYGHEGARGYRTLAGDQLDEARYIRHLAVLHSGGDPRVLAQLRRESHGPDARQAGHMESHHWGNPWDKHDLDHYEEGWGGSPVHMHGRSGQVQVANEPWEIGAGQSHDFVARKTANSPDAEIRGGKRMHQWVYPVPGSYEWQPSTGGLEHRAHARRCVACGLEGRAYPGQQGGLEWRYARSTDYAGKPEREHPELSECPGRAA